MTKYSRIKAIGYILIDPIMFATVLIYPPLLIDILQNPDQVIKIIEKDKTVKTKYQQKTLDEYYD